MSMDFFSRKTVSGRKDHTCEHCRKAIQTGEQHFYCAGKIEGDFNAYREHTDCERAWIGLHDLRGTRWDDARPFLADDDEIDAGEIDWLHEHFPAVAARIWGAPSPPKEPA